MYDVIVIGARAAGAPTAMLLARKGYKVLLVDRASFPSDTLSTHQVQLKGGAALKRWGLLDRVLASNCPPVLQAVFHSGPFDIQGKFPPLDGVAAVVCPRRTVLDKILVEAAVEAGAELRQDMLVEELIQEGGGVTGMRGRGKSGRNGGTARMEENTRLVIGADGKHSLVAQAVQAAEYSTKAVLSCAYYTYWDGLHLDRGETYNLPGAAVGVWPTNDGLAVVYTAYPAEEFPHIRADIEGRFWKTMESLPGLAEKLRSGKQVERFYGSADLPGFYRRPFGPGWALVGDAGMTLDPITGQGIGNSFRDAERLAEAVEAGFSGRTTIEAAMAEYEAERNADTLPMYEFTAQIASFEPPSVEQVEMFAALTKKPEAAGRFFGVLTGSVPVQEFFSPPSLLRILGIASMGRVALGRMKSSRPAATMTRSRPERASLAGRR
jgi:2-polyprenyl-6-methoxyphenol hydroxylase-like FAD-dependent oxidoreductase